MTNEKPNGLTTDKNLVMKPKRTDWLTVSCEVTVRQSHLIPDGEDRDGSRYSALFRPFNATCSQRGFYRVQSSCKIRI
jgi:hypothetical protein